MTIVQQEQEQLKKETIESNELPIDHIYAYKLEPDNKDEVDTKEDCLASSDDDSSKEDETAEDTGSEPETEGE